MANELINLLTGAFGGSFVGALGAAWNKYQDCKQELKLATIEVQKLKLTQEHEVRLAELNMAGEELKASYEGLKASIEADKASYSQGSDSVFLRFVDGIRGIIRPMLTVTLLIYCMVTMVYLTKRYDIILDQGQVYKLVYMLVENLVVCSGIALSWWFGSRPAKDKPY